MQVVDGETYILSEILEYVVDSIFLSSFPLLCNSLFIVHLFKETSLKVCILIFHNRFFHGIWHTFGLIAVYREDFLRNFGVLDGKQ